MRNQELEKQLTSPSKKFSIRKNSGKGLTLFLVLVLMFLSLQ